MIYITKGTNEGDPYELMPTFKEYEEQARIQGKIKEIQQKDKEMTNKTTEQKITLGHGKTYVTAGGERVTVKAQTDSFTDFYKFKGDNNYRYGLNGDFHPLCYGADNKHIIVSEYKEPQVQHNLFTAEQLLVAYNNGKSYGCIFSTSELQSLTKMQSKVITALEAEILELKETAQYLGNCAGLVNRVNGLRKQIFNEITTKKKRLVKLVALQQRMKRSK